MKENDLPAADRIFRVAFGTFLGVSNPENFGGDIDYIRTRWQAEPEGLLSAFDGERLIGANCAINWGSFGYFGPLVIDPAYWNRDVAQLLLAHTMEIFRKWGNTHLGLYTFAQSAKHVSLYRKFGFWPRDLVANMEKPVAVEANESSSANIRLFSETAASERRQFLAQCREITEANFHGLDLTRQIESTDRLGLGDTLLHSSGSGAVAFALCYSGAGTEAGSSSCQIKFAAIRAGANAAAGLAQLLCAAEAFAADHGAPKLTLAVNMAQREAFQAAASAGFRTTIQGVAMETGNAAAGYNHTGKYVLDDWR